MTRSQKLASFIAHHSFVSCFEPTKVEEALQDLDWINTMHDELNNFTRNEVWTLEERPQGARVIGTKWVFRNKQDDQGIVVRNKARLVAKGFSQVEGCPRRYMGLSKPQELGTSGFGTSSLRRASPLGRSTSHNSLRSLMGISSFVKCMLMISSLNHQMKILAKNLVN